MGSQVVYNSKSEQVLADRLTAGQILGYPPGRIFYVSSLGGSDSAGYGMSRSIDPASGAGPFATIDYAIGQCGANQGDVIFVLPGHTETLTSATGIALDVAGVSIIGCGSGRARPAITCFAATTAIGLTISAANTVVRNIRFIGSDTQTSGNLLRVSEDDAKIELCSFEHGAGPLVAVGLTTGSDRCSILDCSWLGTADGPDMAIKILGACRDLIVRRCIFNYGPGAGPDSAMIGTLASSALTRSIIDDCIMLGANSTGIRLLGSASASVPDSLISRIYGVGGAVMTIGAALPFDQGGATVMNSFWSDCIALQPAWLGAAIKVALASNTGKSYVGTSVS